MEPEQSAPPAIDPNRMVALALALIGAGVLWYGFEPVTDLDIWWHMRLGEQILATGTLVPTDPFSHTSAGADWPFKDAGFAVLAHLLWSIGGTAAIVIVKATAFAFTACALWVLLRRVRAVPPALAVVCLALACDGIAYRFTERASTVSLLILVVVLVLAERDRSGERGLWWVVLLTALNANLHRGVIVIPVVMGAYAAARFLETRDRERWQTPALVAVASAAACLATPFGLALVTTSSNLMGQHTSVLTEWAPVSMELVLALTPASLAVGIAVLLGAVSLVRYVRPLPWWDLALVAMALALGLASMRHLPYLAILGIGPAADGLARIPRAWTGRLAPMISLAAGLTAFSSAVVHTRTPPGLGVAPAHYPKLGVEFVHEHSPQGEMFNEFGYGGYLIFHLWPDHRVYVDGRTDLVYPPEHVQRYLASLGNPRALAAETERYGLEWVFLDNAPHDRGRAHLDANPAWVLVHASRRALIYVRKDGPNAELAGRLGYRWLWAHALERSLARAADMGHGDEALDELRRMLDDDPDNLYAVRALARMQPGDPTE